MSKHKDKLHELRRKRAALGPNSTRLVSKESDLPEGEALPEEDTNRLAEIETELEDIRGRLQRLETALEMESDEAKPVEGDEGEERDGTAVVVAPRPFAEAKAFWPDQRGFKAARFLIGCLHAKIVRLAVGRALHRAELWRQGSREGAEHDRRFDRRRAHSASLPAGPDRAAPCPRGGAQAQSDHRADAAGQPDHSAPRRRRDGRLPGRARRHRGFARDVRRHPAQRQEAHGAGAGVE